MEDSIAPVPPGTHNSVRKVDDSCCNDTILLANEEHMNIISVDDMDMPED